MTDTDVDALESALATTEHLLAGVAPGQLAIPTPCPEMNVGQLRDHLVGWATSFAEKLNGREYDGDPNEFRAGDDAAHEYALAARKVVNAYRGGGDAAKQTPAGIVLMETVVHGWDLAMATGQDPAFDDAAISAALSTGRGMLKPEYRGPGKSFAEEVVVNDDAPLLDQLVGFAGRDPDWLPTS